jgi:hypothetical protein
VAGVGTNYTWSITVGGQTATAPQTTSYATPTLSGSNGVTALGALSTQGGTSVTITGANLGHGGSLAIPISVTYWAAAHPSVVYSASGCAVLSAGTRLVCNSTSGVGANLSFSVSVGRQVVNSGPTTLQYQVPSVANVTGGPFHTGGGESVTINVSLAGWVRPLAG